MRAKPVDVDRYRPRAFGPMIGRSVSSLQRWDREGVLRARRTCTDRRHYTHDDCLAVIGQQPKQGRIIAYVRVSSSPRKPEPAHQRAAVEHFCLVSGRVVPEYLEEVGSGLKYRRENF